MSKGFDSKVSFTAEFRGRHELAAVLAARLEKVFLADACRALGFHLGKGAWNQRMLSGHFRGLAGC
jgi:hypothetical protein